MAAFSSAPPQTRARLAVFIDGDHIPPSFRLPLMAEAVRHGHVVSTQLFCDLSLRPDWAAETGIDVTHCKGRPGKNSADISLCIAALDLAYRGLASAFLIASNDRDFEPLIRHLHRMGLSASQMKSPAHPPTPQPAEPKRAKTPARTPLLDMVCAAIKAQGEADGLAIAALNPLLHRQGVSISKEPEKTWRAWLLARPSHFICDPKGPQAKVRLKDLPLAPHTAP